MARYRITRIGPDQAWPAHLTDMQREMAEPRFAADRAITPFAVGVLFVAVLAMVIVLGTAL